jgi:Reverse transcriptase (RNA-dependent DNA polymerase)
MLIAKLVWDMKPAIIDIKTAFLQGKLDGLPSGLTVGSNKKSILQKTIYGLVQSARNFYETLNEVLEVASFVGSKSHPCLWTKWDSEVKNILIVGIYVEKLLFIGRKVTSLSLLMI